MQARQFQQDLEEQKARALDAKDKKEVDDFDAEFQAMLQESTIQAKNFSNEIHK